MRLANHDAALKHLQAGELGCREARALRSLLDLHTLGGGAPESQSIGFPVVRLLARSRYATFFYRAPPARRKQAFSDLPESGLRDSVKPASLMQVPQTRLRAKAPKPTRPGRGFRFAYALTGRVGGKARFAGAAKPKNAAANDVSQAIEVARGETPVWTILHRGDCFRRRQGARGGFRAERPTPFRGPTEAWVRERLLREPCGLGPDERRRAPEIRRVPSPPLARRRDQPGDVVRR